METILEGVYQERTGDLGVETYFQYLLNPQSLQFDSREENLGLLLLSDYDTGYIYTVRSGGPNVSRGYFA